MKRRFLEMAAVLLVTAAAALWLSSRPGPVALSDLSIHGVRPGMTRPQVEALLGPAPAGRTEEGRTVTAYDDVLLTWFGGRVSEVVGAELDREGSTVLRAGGSPQEAYGLLGQPFVSAVRAVPHDAVEEVWFGGALTCTYRDGRLLSVRLAPGGSSASR